MQTIQNKLINGFKNNEQLVAIEYGSNKITYKELYEKSLYIKNCLINSNIEKGTPIAILIEDKLELICSIIGVLLAGCAFAPLDVDYPKSRLNNMIKSCDINYLLADNKINGSLSQFIDEKLDINVININELMNGEKDIEYTDIEYNIEDKIYIYYTSGTSGEPKAILGQNKGLVHFLEWEIATFCIKKGYRVSQFTSQCHDPFLRDIFIPLCVGGTICIPERKEILFNTDQIIKWIDSNDINIVHCTPSLFRIFNSDQLDSNVFTNLKYIFFAGESLNPYELKNWYSIFGDAITLVNLYGATETTLAKLYYIINTDDCSRTSIPVGKPMEGCRAIILNNNSPCNNGEIGEICIRTPYRTLGYINDSDLNSKKFVPNPFSTKSNDIIYKTGDLGRILPDGNIEINGRMDKQIKIRGYRVEVKEIESQLAKHPEIDSCIVNYKINNLYLNEKEVKHCTECGITSEYPNINFDSNNVCNLCLSYKKYKKKADNYFKNEEEFKNLFIKDKKKNKHDCLLLFSGGKDSTYALYKLVDMGLNVLAYTFDNGFISEEALNNIKRTIDELKIDHIIDKYSNMDKIFCDGLKEELSVCNGCFKVLRINSTKIAFENDIKYIVTGFSRGQIYELRLGNIFHNQIFDETEINNKVLEQRILYHNKNDYVINTLGIEKRLGKKVIESTVILDFYRYIDVTQDEIIQYLKSRSKYWSNPTDTGFCSSNCKINDVGIYLQRKERHYDNYSLPNSWEVRTGHVSLEKSLSEYNKKVDTIKVYDILNKIGYTNKYRQNNGKNGILIAYYKANEILQESKLRQYLEKNLPSYMIPSYFIKIDKYPMTLNGKIDYESLPEPNKKQKENLLMPRDEVEYELSKIWCEILDIEIVGINDDFHKIGGHSLNIMALISKVNKVFHVDYPLGDLFSNVTIENMAKNIKQDKNYLKFKGYKDTKMIISSLMNSGGIENKIVFDNSVDFDFKFSKINNIPDSMVLENIEVFKEIFFKDCVYNSFIPVLKHFNKNKLSVLVNDTIIYKYNNDQRQLNVNFITEKYSDEIFNDIGLGLQGEINCENVVDKIINAINNKRLVIINLDCYYQSIRKDMYLKHSWPHFILLYGYDQEQQIFYVVEHDQVNSLDYKKYECKFEDIYKSYKLYLANYHIEGRFTYFEFFNKFDDNLSKDYYIKKYLRNMLSNKTEIYKGINEIDIMSENYKIMINDEEEIFSNLDSMIYGLNNIINAKNAEYYIISELIDDQHIIDLKLFVVKNWVYIRAILQKYKFSKKYDRESLENLLTKYNNIKHTEYIYYNKIYDTKEDLKWEA